MDDGMIKSGSLILLTEGEYSDYSAKLIARALADLSPDALLAEFRSAAVPLDKWEGLTRGQFVAWLIKTGKIEEVDAEEWHLGSYGELGNVVSKVKGTFY